MDGGVVEEDERKEGKVLVCRKSKGRVSFYIRSEERRGVTVSIMEVALWAAKGQGERGSMLLASW